MRSGGRAPEVAVFASILQLLTALIIATCSCRQLLQQHLRFFQIERVEALSKPPIHRSQQFARIPEPCPGRARGAQGSWRRGVPRIWLVVGGRPPKRARNIVPLLGSPARLTSALSHQPRDLPQPPIRSPTTTKPTPAPIDTTRLPRVALIDTVRTRDWSAPLERDSFMRRF